MKELFVKKVVNETTDFLNNNQRLKLEEILTEICVYYKIEKLEQSQEEMQRNNEEILKRFISSKEIEECSIKTLSYYKDTISKMYIKKYLETRTDDNEALFVSLIKPYNRLGISGIEILIRSLGRKANINNVHPHKFRRTMATMAVDKGMPIEQVQKLLGHIKIDTTMEYAMANQNNVKNSYRKYIT